MKFLIQETKTTENITIYEVEAIDEKSAINMVKNSSKELIKVDSYEDETIINIESIYIDDLN